MELFIGILGLLIICGELGKLPYCLVIGILKAAKDLKHKKS